MGTDIVAVPVDKKQYLLAHIYISKCWIKSKPSELEWFISSMRGDLPIPPIPPKNYKIIHLFLPAKQYLMALESFTTRLGVRST